MRTLEESKCASCWGYNGVCWTDSDECTPQLRNSPVHQRLKLSLLEQLGHFETFCERKDKCIKVRSLYFSDSAITHI